MSELLTLLLYVWSTLTYAYCTGEFNFLLQQEIWNDWVAYDQ